MVHTVSPPQIEAVGEEHGEHGHQSGNRDVAGTLSHMANHVTEIAAVECALLQVLHNEVEKCGCTLLLRAR
eukprot:6215524-Amphidinium_carterae.1